MGPFVWNSNQNTPQPPPYSLYIKGGVATPNVDMMGFDLRKWTKELLDYLHVYTWDEYCQGAFNPCAWITIPPCGSTDPLHIYNYGSGGVTISTSGCTWTFDEDCNLTLPGSLYFPDGSYLSSATDLGTINISDGSTLLTGVKTIYFSGATVSGTAPNGDVSINLPSLPSLIPVVSGGTGLSTYNLGDTLYGNSSHTLSILPGNTVNIPYFLMQTGTGSASAAPAWFNLFNTVNNWVAQKISSEGYDLPTSLSAGVPAVYLGYGGQGGMNGDSGTIIVYDRTNVTGGYANIVTRESLLKAFSSGWLADTTISTASPGGGGASQEIQYANCAGLMFSNTGGLNLYYKSPFITVAIKELGYGTYLGYNATVPAFQMRARRAFTGAQHKANIEVVVPETLAITGSTVATRYDLFSMDTKPFIQHYLSTMFTLNAAELGIAPTANVHIGASNGTVGSAPLKFSASNATLDTSGTSSTITSILLSTPEQGAMEVNSNAELLYSTNTTADSRGFVEVARYTAVLTTYQITSDDYTVDCTGGGTFNVTLPTAVGIQGRIYKIKNSGAGTITVATTSSQTIDGVTTKTLSTQYQVITVQSTGSNWIVV